MLTNKHHLTILITSQLNMFTPDDIKDYIIYDIEPYHLCELLGDSLQEIVLMMKKDRKLMGYDEEQNIATVWNDYA